MKKNALKDNSAFTIMEILVSIAILSGLMIAVAQTASWCFQERKRNHAQFLALQLLENLKEEVKVAGFEKINPSWGLQMKDLSRYKALPPECTIEVETGSVPENKFLKRVQLTILWRAGLPLESRRINADVLVAARTTSGGKP